MILSSYRFTPCYPWKFICSLVSVVFVSFALHFRKPLSLTSHLCCFVAFLMEHKRDANAAGLAWPKSSTRTSQNPSLLDETTPTPHGTLPAPGTLTPSTTGNESVTPSGMYTSDPHPGAPFPEPEHHPSSCSSSARTLHRTSGASDPLQDLYPLQQRARVIRRRNSDQWNLQNQGP